MKILFYEYGAPEKKKIFLVYSENIVHNDEQKKSEKFDLLTLILKCGSKKLNTRKFFFKCHSLINNCHRNRKM